MVICTWTMFHRVVTFAGKDRVRICANVVLWSVLSDAVRAHDRIYDDLGEIQKNCTDSIDYEWCLAFDVIFHRPLS